MLIRNLRVYADKTSVLWKSGLWLAELTKQDEQLWLLWQL